MRSCWSCLRCATLGSAGVLGVVCCAYAPAPNISTAADTTTNFENFSLMTCSFVFSAFLDDVLVVGNTQAQAESCAPENRCRPGDPDGSVVSGDWQVIARNPLPVPKRKGGLLGRPQIRDVVAVFTSFLRSTAGPLAELPVAQTEAAGTRGSCHP